MPASLGDRLCKTPGVRPACARGRAVHPRLRAASLLRALARGDVDRQGQPPARGRRQPLGPLPGKVHRLSRPAGSRRATRWVMPARAGRPVPCRRAGGRATRRARSSLRWRSSWGSCRPANRSASGSAAAIRTFPGRKDGSTSPACGPRMPWCRRTCRIIPPCATTSSTTLAR